MTISSKNSSKALINPSSGQAPLSDWGLIFVEGLDATSFLQNQLTNSILGLKRSKPGQTAEGPAAVRLVGYCSPKGRLLASAWLALMPQSEQGEDRFALFISKDIAASTAKRLSMFVLRSKVKVSDVSDAWHISGLYGSQANTANASDSLALRMPDVLYQDQSIARVLLATPVASEYSLDKAALIHWNLLEVLSAIPRIVLATQEQFVPQMINFESVAGVDFKKGCYPGQEIVARSQYRGVIKRRLQIAGLRMDPVDSMRYMPGIDLFHSDDALQPAGMVVLSAIDPQEPDSIKLQVECKLEALEHGEIHLGSVDGPVLKMSLLPYQLLEI
jgi:folate-binding protein YgfZ